jgi:hypothetical protein
VGTKEKPPPAIASTTNQLMTKNIINYSNDSLSIASVVSGPTPVNPQAIPVSPKTSPASNKISLVPTKLLLKSPAVNSFKQNPTIVYSSVQSTTTPGTITTNAQSSIPMKVVFVNALNNNANAQQNAQKPQQITLNNKSIAQLQQSQNSSFLTNKLISTSQGQKVQIVQSQTHFNSVPKVTTTVNSSEQSGKINNRQSLGTKSPSKGFMVPRSAETNVLRSLSSY